MKTTPITFEQINGVVERLTAAGWKLQSGWRKKGWCFMFAADALAVEAAFSGMGFPNRSEATSAQVMIARAAVEQRTGGAR